MTGAARKIGREQARCRLPDGERGAVVGNKNGELGDPGSARVVLAGPGDGEAWPRKCRQGRYGAAGRRRVRRRRWGDSSSGLSRLWRGLSIARDVGRYAEEPVAVAGRACERRGGLGGREFEGRK